MPQMILLFYLFRILFYFTLFRVFGNTVRCEVERGIQMEFL